jgi:hypothetical protein
MSIAPMPNWSWMMRSSKATRVTLSRPFSDLLVELSISLHKFMMYPRGHPSLEPAAASVVRKAERIMEDRATIAFGVARHQLIIEGVATDPGQPVLRRLADGLNSHHLGAVSISRGVMLSEIAEALGELGADLNTVVPIGLRPPAELPSWPHIHLHPLTFERLMLMADAPIARQSQDDSRAVELWIGLARAAMTKEHASADGGSIPTEPAAIARAIDEPGRAEAYDQVIVGYLQQIARELRTASGVEASALRRRTGRLIAALNPDTLRRLVDMGGDLRQRRAFVLDAAHGMAVDSVLGIVKAAADASGQTISQGLVRMFSKLAMHAEEGTAPAREMASAALRDQVDQLLTGWALPDPIPTEYGLLLHHVATDESASQSRGESDENAGERDPVRVAQMSLEVGTAGILLDRTIDRVVDQGRVNVVLDLLAEAPPDSSAAIDAIMNRLTHPDTIARLVAREPIDFASLDRLLPALSLDAHRVLIDALANTEHRRTRRKLLDRLARTQTDIAALLIERLNDERWFVQRNMLVLLHGSGRVPSSFSAVPWTTHPHPHVRYEAIRLQLTMGRERSRALRAALTEDDPRFVRLGLAALQQECPPELVAVVTRVANDPNASEQLRTLAVQALGRSASPQALETLLAWVDGGTTLFGRPRLPTPTPFVLAALSALSEGWSTDQRASAVLALAGASDDSQIRHAARRDGA